MSTTSKSEPCSWLNAAIKSSITVLPLVVGVAHLSLVFAQEAAVPAENAPLNPLHDNRWDSKDLHNSWMPLLTQHRRNKTAISAFYHKTVAERVAAVNKVFAQLADELEDFTDFGGF